MQMPPVFDDRRPVSPVSSNLREQAVNSYRSNRVLDQRGVVSLCPDRYRQIFAGNQTLILKPRLLAEAQLLSHAEIVQHQRYREGSPFLLHGIDTIVLCDSKFGDIAGLVLHGCEKFQLVCAHGLANGPHRQSVLIDVFYREGQIVGLRRAHRIAAVVTHHSALRQTVVTETQIVKFIRCAHGCFAVKYSVHAAALGVILHHPVSVPQLRLGLRFRVEPGGGGIRVSLAVGGHIDQRSLFLRLVRVRGGRVHLLNILAGCVDVALARRLEPGHPVLHGGEDHLRTAVQLRLADVLLHFGNGDHGQGKQDDDDHDRHHHFQQRKAVCIVPFCPVFHGIPFSFRRFCAGHFKMTSK